MQGASTTRDAEYWLGLENRLVKIERDLQAERPWSVAAKEVVSKEYRSARELPPGRALMFRYLHPESPRRSKKNTPIGKSGGMWIFDPSFELDERPLPLVAEEVVFKKYRSAGELRPGRALMFQYLPPEAPRARRSKKNTTPEKSDGIWIFDPSYGLDPDDGRMLLRLVEKALRRLRISFSHPLEEWGRLAINHLTAHAMRAACLPDTAGTFKIGRKPADPKTYLHNSWLPFFSISTALCRCFFEKAMRARRQGRGRPRDTKRLEQIRGIIKPFLPVWHIGSNLRQIAELLDRANVALPVQRSPEQRSRPYNNWVGYYKLNKRRMKETLKRWLGDT
jgi:hypothetical protein